MMKKNFLICGLTGWCMEIIFTSLQCIGTGDMRFIGQTSLWMFPIYGSAVLIYPIYQKLRNLPMIIRGILYGFGIIVFEYISGFLLRLIHSCPWDYSGKPNNIDGLIRLDYIPFWICAGLIFEFILRHLDKDNENTNIEKTRQQQIGNPLEF